MDAGESYTHEEQGYSAQVGTRVVGVGQGRRFSKGGRNYNGLIVKDPSEQALEGWGNGARGERRGTRQRGQGRPE